MQTSTEFRFNTKLDQTILLGTKAKNIPELLNGLRSAPDASIYFHTHKFLQQHHYLSPEPPNDFAYWVTSILNEAALGERLSSIDIIQFDKISRLRKRFVEIIEDYLETSHRSVDAPAGQEFFFMSAQTFVFATPYVALNLTEFKEILRKVSIHSLYYHVFDAALRLKQGENDFSVWFRRMGEPSLADEVLRLNPYTYTLESLRQKLIHLVGQYGQH
jgi:uncharacterized protein DUF5752